MLYYGVLHFATQFDSGWEAASDEQIEESGSLIQQIANLDGHNEDYLQHATGPCGHACAEYSLTHQSRSSPYGQRHSGGAGESNLQSSVFCHLASAILDFMAEQNPRQRWTGGS